MVHALLAGTKTQTRRLVKPQPPAETGEVFTGWYHPTVIDRHGTEQPGQETYGAWTADGGWGRRCPYGQPGDRLWVRENWRTESQYDHLAPRDVPKEAAFMSEVDFPNPTLVGVGKLRPSIHMPRWFSTITLEITSVRVERLQTIWANDADCIAEGIEEMPPHPCGTRMWRNYLPGHQQGWSSNLATPGNSFATLWRSINGDTSWDANPWVWVVEFRKLP